MLRATLAETKNRMSPSHNKSAATPPGQIARDASLLRDIANRIRTGKRTPLTGVWGSAGPLTAATLGQHTHRPVLYVTGHLDDADAIEDDLDLFLRDAPEATRPRVHLFPAWESSLSGDAPAEHGQAATQRLTVLNRLACVGKTQDLFVAPLLALLQPVPTPQALAAGRRTLRVGDSAEIDELIGWLVDAGYEPTDPVDQPGEFAHRGGILDVFCPIRTAGSDDDALDQAVRIEFFGDEIDSIRRVDLDTQRSTTPIDSCDLLALNATTLPASDVTTLLDYLPANTLIVLPEPNELRDLATQLYDRTRDDLIARKTPDAPAALRTVDELFSGFDTFAQATLFLFTGPTHDNDGAAQRLGVRSLECLAINTAEALAELEQLSHDAAVWVYCANDAERDRFADMLTERHPDLAERVHLARGHLTQGFHWPELKLVAVGHHEIYRRYAKVRRIRKVRTGRPLQSLLDLADGDYVVHVAHGIAKFQGLGHIDRDGDGGEEYLRLRFADNAVLSVPVSQINLVQKYVGAKGTRPRLSKLGGKSWARTRERVTEAVEDLAAEMLRIQAVRRAAPGVAYPGDTELQCQFAEEFPYTETEDQLLAIRETLRDLSHASPMDRLICGDVGYGKTEVAMRAACTVVEAGHQVAVLVPTTILADQHSRTFQERFADYPVTIEMLSRFRTAKEQTQTLERLALGQVDILIGTHRLLSKDVKFPDLGLVVIDEEQRFGVTHKEHLKHLRASVDVLTLTATPIPRTLHMALLGLRDIASLQTPPMDRRSIYTEVTARDDELIRSAILRERNRDGQVFFVHNRVMDIEAVAEHVRTLVPGLRVVIGHGQMPERTLERVMKEFTGGEIDVLVCTTIIESGLDIPTANTMIIDEADRFGLAELHQLRGRVGRYRHKAYCYLLLPERRTVNPVAAKRLKAIEDFSDLGAGFQIAMRDLEIRGAGNLLGSQQSGHIAAVGYELYCQLLDQSVHSLRGEPAPKRLDVHIELGLNVSIPRAYIPANQQRMDLYRRLAACGTRAELQQLQRDMLDAFGRPPKPVGLLVDIAKLRLGASDMGITSLHRKSPDVIFRVESHRLAEPLLKTLTQLGTVRLPDVDSVYWRPSDTALLKPRSLLKTLLECLEWAQKNYRKGRTTSLP